VEAGSGEVGSREVGIPEVGTGQAGFLEVRISEVGGREVSPLEVGVSERGSAEIRGDLWMVLSPLVPGSNAFAKLVQMFLVCHSVPSFRHEWDLYEMWMFWEHP